LFGPGSVADDAHAVGESTRVEALLTAAETYRGVLDQLLRDDH
jgi:acetylornithine deacetylase/succinyl-diaminopimelate desuccinylase-like protein